MSAPPKMSKKLLYATVFGVVIVGGALYVSTNTKVAIPKEEVLADSNLETVQTIDTLWQDTDNASQENSLTGTTPSLTETDILTRNLISPYVEQVENDTYTKSSGKKIVDEITEQIFTLDYDPLNLTDILITNDLSKSSTLQYKNNLYKAMQPLFGLDEYELTIYARAVQNNSKGDFDSLSMLADVYSKVSDEILTITAPEDVSSVHLAVINSLYKFSTVLQDMSKGFNDPAASLSGTGNFTQAEESLTQSFNRLKTYFTLKDIGNIAI